MDVLTRTESALQEPIWFFDHCTSQTWVSTRQHEAFTRSHRPATSPRGLDVTFSFSELKYLFEQPYSFKLRFLYGFNPPLHEALWYAQDCTMRFRKYTRGQSQVRLTGQTAARDLVERHLSHPYPELPGRL